MSPALASPFSTAWSASLGAGQEGGTQASRVPSPLVSPPSFGLTPDRKKRLPSHAMGEVRVSRRAEPGRGGAPPTIPSEQQEVGGPAGGRPPAGFLTAGALHPGAVRETAERKHGCRARPPQVQRTTPLESQARRERAPATRGEEPPAGAPQSHTLHTRPHVRAQQSPHGQADTGHLRPQGVTGQSEDQKG